MGTLNALFHILLVCSHSLSIPACDVNYTNQPRYGYRCVTSSNTEVTLWQTNRPQCVWKCLKLKTCHYINHNYDTGQCDLGLNKCESLVPVTGISVSVFGPPRDKCVLWATGQESGRVSVELQFRGKVIHLARMTTNNILLIGKFIPATGTFWANNEGERVGPVRESDQDIELLLMDPACTLSWMPYMAGGLLPVGAISGGLLHDGSTTYVSKVTHDDRLAFDITTLKQSLCITNWMVSIRKRPWKYWYWFDHFYSLSHGYRHGTIHGKHVVCQSYGNVETILEFCVHGMCNEASIRV